MINCRFCGEKRVSNVNGFQTFRCGSNVLDSKPVYQSLTCVTKERDQLRERIKRLEEAGDFAILCVTHEEPFRSEAVNTWAPAKEAKP